jgi:hypothetical protein
MQAFAPFRNLLTAMVVLALTVGVFGCPTQCIAAGCGPQVQHQTESATASECPVHATKSTKHTSSPKRPCASSFAVSAVINHDEVKLQQALAPVAGPTSFQTLETPCYLHREMLRVPWRSDQFPNPPVRLLLRI